MSKPTYDSGRLFDALLSLREVNYEYHNHKETTTLTIAPLFLGSVLLVSQWNCGLRILWSVFFVATLFMLRYQFYWRHHARTTTLVANSMILDLIKKDAPYSDEDFGIDPTLDPPFNTKSKVFRERYELHRGYFSGKTIWRKLLSPGATEIATHIAVAASYALVWVKK